VSGNRASRYLDTASFLDTQPLTKQKAVSWEISDVDQRFEYASERYGMPVGRHHRSTDWNSGLAA
jgi:hypothetical protein